MAKKLTISAKIRQYLKEHPAATSKQVADALGVKIQNVYVVRSKDKKVAPKKNWKTVGLVTTTRAVTEQGEKLLKIADNVNHPAHYKVGGIETIDFIEAKQLNYNLGNVVKYITRADHKANTYEDLCKARWYLNREISKHLGANNQ